MPTALTTVTPTIEQAVEFFDGWVFVSDAIDHHLDSTRCVHHVQGCGVSNGQNRLRLGTLDELTGVLLHCGRCRSMGHS